MHYIPVLLGCKEESLSRCLLDLFSLETIDGLQTERPSGIQITHTAVNKEEKYGCHNS